MREEGQNQIGPSTHICSISLLWLRCR